MKTKPAGPHWKVISKKGHAYRVVYFVDRRAEEMDAFVEALRKQGFHVEVRYDRGAR